MSDTLRLCRDCRFRRKDWWVSLGEDRCTNHAVSPVKVNLVSGSTKQKPECCDIARIRDACGPSGKLWEPRS